MQCHVSIHSAGCVITDYGFTVMVRRYIGEFGAALVLGLIVTN